jgi:hypothetical protein
MEAVGSAFSGNPLNVGIIAGGVIVILVLVMQYLKGRNLKIGKFEISKKNIGQPIQRIDDNCKIKNRAAVNKYRDVLLAFIPGTDKLRAEAVAAAVIWPVYETVQRNHFTHIFSDRKLLDEWRKDLIADIHNRITVLEYHTDNKWPDLHDESFEKVIEKLVNDCLSYFIDNTIEACYAKIETYAKANEDGMKELIDKNERYVASIKGLQ